MIGTSEEKIYELKKPQKYSSFDVARVFSKLLNKNVSVQSIPQDKWKEALQSVGFTENTVANLSDMTQAVIGNKIIPERPNHTIKLPTSLEYIDEQLNK